MELNSEGMTLTEKIKRIAAFRGYNITKLGQKFNEHCGTNYNQQSFSRKMLNGAITLDELQAFADILNFQIVFDIKD